MDTSILLNYKKITPQIRRKIPIEIQDFLKLKHFTNDLQIACFLEYKALNGIYLQSFCDTCHKPLLYKQIKMKQQCCSPECNNRNPKNKSKREQTFLQKYGYSSILSNPGIRNLANRNVTQKGELEVLYFVNKFDLNIIHKSYVLGNLELDIYIPELKLGIEFNGDYWHQTSVQDYNKQIFKTNLCESKGIRLIHIWEHEWKNNRVFLETLITLYLENKIHQNEFQKLLEPFNDRLPRDYFSTLDFQGKIEDPVLEKIGNHNVYKTGYILEFK